MTAPTLLSVELASAAVSVCEGADVQMDGQPDPRWEDVVARLCADLAAMKDRDPEASVRIITAEADLIVEVTLADGRSAIRRVKRPRALRSVLEALLTLPPRPPASREQASGPAPESAPKESPSPKDAPPPKEAPPPITGELAVSAFGRVAGAGFVSVGPSAEAYLSTGRWLFGIYARSDAWQHAPAPRGYHYELDTAAAGVAVARRFALGPVDVDIGFAPRLVVETESFVIPPAPPPQGDNDDDDDATRTTADLRLAPFTRVHFAKGPLRFFAGADVEVSPARLRRKVRAASQLPALPAWSGGISAGVSWSAP